MARTKVKLAGELRNRDFFTLASMMGVVPCCIFEGCKKFKLPMSCGIIDGRCIYKDYENVLAKKLFPSLNAGMPLIADRGLGCYPFYREALKASRAAVYHERRKIEMGYGEIKIILRKQANACAAKLRNW